MRMKLLLQESTVQGVVPKYSLFCDSFSFAFYLQMQLHLTVTSLKQPGESKQSDIITLTGVNLCLWSLQQPRELPIYGKD